MAPTDGSYCSRIMFPIGPGSNPWSRPAMDESEILGACTEVLREVLGDDSIVLEPETRRSDIANWDSFSYVTFIAVLEMKLGMKFGVGEIESFERVGDIVKTIATKQAR